MYSDNIIGYRELLALQLAKRDGQLYTSGYGQMFEAAMVCELLGLLEEDHAAWRLRLTPRGERTLAAAPKVHLEDGWTMVVPS